MGNDERHDAVEEALTSGLEREVTRRDLLKLVGAGAGVAALSPIIAACAGGGKASPAGGASGSAAGGSAAGGSGGVAGGKIQAPGTKVSLDFWNPFTGPDGPYLQKLVERFNQETPNVQVKSTTQKDIYASLHAAKAANRLPQTSIVHLDAIPQNASDGIFAPIDDLISTLGLSASDFTEDVWTQGEWKGARYGVPLDTHVMGFYWNKDLFKKAGLDPEKPPTNRDEFVNAAKAITEKAGVPGFKVVTAGQGANFLLGIEWATAFYQGGGKVVSDDKTQVTINTDAGVNSANFWKSLIDMGISPKNVESDVESADFQAGKNGMIMNGIWQTNSYLKALGPAFGAAPVPKIFGSGVWSGSHNFGITTRQMSDDEKKGAWYFIGWMSEHSIDWAGSGQIPARKSVRESEAFKKLPQAPIAAEVPDARFTPAIPAVADIVTGPQGGGNAAVQAATGKKDAKAALDENAAQLTKILQANKQKYGF